MVLLNILGPPELCGRRRDTRITGGKLSKVAGLLAVRANQYVAMQTISEELWAGSPPRNELTTIRTHVYNLRRILESVQGEPPQARLLTRPMGYLLSVPAELVDVAVFKQGVTRGRVLLAEGRNAEAADTFRDALAVWRGSALAGVAAGPVLAGHVAELTERRASALEYRIEADLLAGRHRDLVPELRELVGADPLNEWMQARLIEALVRSGRSGEALRSFQDARTHLDEQLGLEPSIELRQAQHRIFAAANGQR
ncbi:hypothetical protein BS329_13760 [Amycolatopsis coloradensis]|uniref:OmpR/PhoB-type domain-containing protein n=1 Tax=Amycolatopsis coloradensis TaxID=76021 RepID=A0A1R0KUR5_9PSEU|nr:hypothetical protein BS329_13760 [Amycolatopsis coloradensis]